jgi:tetratricopeptide (TPR) repeat protein
VQKKYAQALQFYSQSLAVRRKSGEREGEANTLNNIGAFYYDQGQYANALDYYDQSYQKRVNSHCKRTSGHQGKQVAERISSG